MDSFAFALIATCAPGIAFAATCFKVAPESAVDVAFLQSLKGAGISVHMETADMPCVSDADYDRAAVLRDKASRENPKRCVSFEGLCNVSRLARELRQRGIRAWREERADSSITVCHLPSDARKVKALVEQVCVRTK